MAYKYYDISQEDINKLKNLWEKNRNFHEESTRFFSYEYSNLNFEERMSHIFLKDKIKFKITVAENIENIIIGYCISIMSNNKGEVGTMYVDEAYRGKGIGKTFLKEHLKWFDYMGCKDICVEVLVENKDAIKLYEKVGFQQNIVTMKVPERYIK